jgi:dTDP-4-dehydrorhamnose reductase
MKIVVVGSTGQLGTDLMKILREDHEMVGLTHQDIEVSNYNSCLTLKEHHPDIIINTAAFHKTDQCEEEPEKAFLVNAIGSKNVTKVSIEIEATTIFISTDYVFDGTKSRPYVEDDAPNPINTYGISKLAGELCARQNSKHYVIRVASLFGTAGASGKGGNFVETMISKARKNEQITVVDDMWMSPTYTKDAVQIMKRIIESKLPFGTYHATNKGFCTWFQFTEEIFSLLSLTPTLTPIKTTQLQVKARRPRFSALKSTKLSKHGIQAREWTEALSNYLVEKGYKQH